MRPPDPPTRPSSGWVDPSTGRRLPERIGRYRIVSRLGEGGMGVVFEAEQDSPRRTVALKVLGTGALTEEMERRFAREAEVLGRLQHPGIAQVYEAGSFASEVGPQPFFAMELVRGEPLTRYADAQRLDMRARVELLARVADAVQHAHERGVIHRDLKPGNVLVTADGQPKVLDFGVARATDSDVRQATLRTDLGQLLGTLAYMSPEQASGDPSKLDARSDVYSLGVVLYELLAGRLPYELGGLAVPEAARVVRDEEARPISRLRRELAGDLETIAAKALEKDPARRYASAAALAADLRSFLAHEPVQARPASTIYRLRKFARRNRALVLGLSGAFAALVVGLVGTSLGFLEARNQRDEARAAHALAAAQEARASAEAARASRTADFLKGLLGGIDPAFAQGADTTLLRRILADTEARMGELDDLPLAQADIENTIGLTYAAIGEHERGLEHLRAGHAVHERELGPEAEETIRARANVATTLSQLSRYAEAEPELRGAFETARRVLGPDAPTTLDCGGVLATHLYETGRIAESHDLAQLVLAGQRRTLGDDAERTLGTMLTVSTALLTLYRLDEAQAVLTELAARSTRVRGPDHPQTLKILSNQSGLAGLRARPMDSIALQREACERSARVNGPDHLLTLELRSLLGLRLIEAGLWDEAEATLRAVCDEGARRLGAGHRAILHARAHLANLLRERGRTAEAIALYEEVVEGWLALRGEDAIVVREARIGLASALVFAGELARAEELLEHVLARAEALGASDEAAGLPHEERNDLHDAWFTLGNLQLEQGRVEEASESYERALAIAGVRSTPGKRSFANLHSALALVRTYQARYGEAETLLRAAIEMQTERLGPGHPDTLTSRFNLGACLRNAGRTAEALPELLAAAEGWSAAGGDRHQNSMRSRELLLGVLAEIDAPAAEEPWRRKELALARETHAADDPALGEPLCALAWTLLAQGEHEEARARIEEALVALGPLDASDWRVAWCEVLTAELLAAEGRAEEAASLIAGADERLRRAPEPVRRRGLALVAARSGGTAGEAAEGNR